MWVLAASMLLTSCAATQEERINNAIEQVMDQYQCVGISAAVVQDGQIVYNQSFG